jgi:hypothetical protein
LSIYNKITYKYQECSENIENAAVEALKEFVPQIVRSGKWKSLPMELRFRLLRNHVEAGDDAPKFVTENQPEEPVVKMREKKDEGSKLYVVFGLRVVNVSKLGGIVDPEQAIWWGIKLVLKVV